MSAQSDCRRCLRHDLRGGRVCTAFHPHPIPPLYWDRAVTCVYFKPAKTPPQTYTHQPVRRLINGDRKRRMA